MCHICRYKQPTYPPLSFVLLALVRLRLRRGALSRFVRAHPVRREGGFCARMKKAVLISTRIPTSSCKNERDYRGGMVDLQSTTYRPKTYHQSLLCCQADPVSWNTRQHVDHMEFVGYEQQWRHEVGRFQFPSCCEVDPSASTTQKWKFAKIGWRIIPEYIAHEEITTLIFSRRTMRSHIKRTLSNSTCSTRHGEILYRKLFRIGQMD